MSANPRDIPTMRIVVGSTSERYNTEGDISFGLIRYNTTDNNVEAYAKDGWLNLHGGYDNSASGSSSSAFGTSNEASGTNSSAVGYENTASGSNSSAVGYYNNAKTDYSTAFGYKNNTYGWRSSAFGNENTTNGNYSVGIGYKAKSTGGKMYFGIHGCESSNTQIYFAKSTDETVMDLHCPGIVTSDGTTLTSDDRVKENEKLIVNAMETLSKLTPQIYDKYYNMDLSGSFQVESGLIAQEVYYNAPELRHLVHLGQDTDASGNEYTPTPEEMDLSCVDIANDPDYGSHGWSKTKKSTFNYSGLIPYLVKSNQELSERIETLKTENTELKTDISFIKTENTEQNGEIIQLTTDISLIRNHIGL